FFGISGHELKRLTDICSTKRTLSWSFSSVRVCFQLLTYQTPCRSCSHVQAACSQWDCEGWNQLSTTCPPWSRSTTKPLENVLSLSVRTICIRRGESSTGVTVIRLRSTTCCIV